MKELSKNKEHVTLHCINYFHKHTNKCRKTLHNSQHLLAMLGAPPLLSPCLADYSIV